MYITESDEILLSIQEVAQEIGVVPATIRNWEKQGILTSKRAKNGYRIFDHQDVTRLRSLIHYAKKHKISIYAAHRLLLSTHTVDEPKLDTLPEKNIASKALKSEKWKKCRLERGFVLEDVAGAIKISPSYLYKIENKQTNVSLDILQRLADFYGENLLYYIAEAQTEKHFVKKGGGEPIDIGLEGVSVKSLIALNKINLSAMLYRIAPNSGRTHAQSHHGEEFMYILSGKIHFTLANTKYVLSAGDSFSFRSPDTHTWFNHEKKEASILWIYVPI
ncbi:MAG: helix-turn-helix domain-containing protein [Treponema sp.]|jgi:DNA-binding transcriptional MerR regulator/quercetin dioxygenase-like cupin family protein|nr:helix-turn-helix domain-containing protein [Treponema sp.]